MFAVNEENNVLIPFVRDIDEFAEEMNELYRKIERHMEMAREQMGNDNNTSVNVLPHIGDKLCDIFNSVIELREYVINEIENGTGFYMRESPPHCKM